MSNPLHAAHYPDNALQQVAPIVQNVQVARDTYRVRLAASDIAKRIVPGQFLMLRDPTCGDPLLGRPLALYDTVVLADGEPEGVDVVYLAVGKFTCRLARMQPGEQVAVWGPLGNGFSTEPAEHLVMVGGGIGQTPFLALARERLGLRLYGTPPRKIEPSSRVTLCYGVRTAEYQAGVEDFESVGAEVLLSTDDGSRGHHGLVGDLVEQVLADTASSPRIVCCGPEPMMAAVSRIAATHNVPCQVSLETPMACGIGICFSCVAKVKGADGQWDYRRTCVEGPVFKAEDIVW